MISPGYSAIYKNKEPLRGRTAFIRIVAPKRPSIANAQACWAGSRRTMMGSSYTLVLSATTHGIGVIIPRR